MGARRTKIIILSLIIAVGAIPFLLEVSIAETEKKAIFKIPQEEKEATKPIEKPKEPEAPKPQETVPSTEKGKEAVPYSYDPTNKVDPFKSFITVREELEEKEARERPRTYLETLDLSQLTISAIILTGTEKWALARDSKGDGHVIKIGTPMGKRGGRVTQILEDKVIVREYYRDIRGRELSRDRTLKLPVLVD